MQEITKLQINRSQLKEKFFYYDGCEIDNTDSNKAEAAEKEIINLVADVLIDILLKESL